MQICLIIQNRQTRSSNGYTRGHQTQPTQPQHRTIPEVKYGDRQTERSNVSSSRTNGNEIPEGSALNLEVAMHAHSENSPPTSTET